MLTTLFMLVYGDYPDMHRQAISPLLRQDPEKVSVRLWLNAVCLETFEWLLHNAPEHWLIYVSSQNPPKYPTMRKLFNDPANPITTPWVTWLDDDTNIAFDDWLAKTEEFVAADSTVVFFGAQYWKKHLAGVEHWIRRAKWYTQRPFMQAGARRKRCDRGAGIAFLRGSYWWLRLTVLRALGWPDPRLQHNGGDTALSEAIWQARLPQHAFSYGIADELAPRRGRSENPAGFRHKLINATDASVPAMLGRMEEYEDRLVQVGIPFIKRNSTTLLLGKSGEHAEADWPEPTPTSTTTPATTDVVETQAARPAAKKRRSGESRRRQRPVVQHKEKPIYAPRPPARKTNRERLVERLRQKRAKKQQRGGDARRQDSRGQQ